MTSAHHLRCYRKHSTRWETPFSSCTSNLVKISWSMAEICPKIEFGGRILLPVLIHCVSSYENLPVCDHTKFHLTPDSKSGSPDSYSSFLVTIHLSRLVRRYSRVIDRRTDSADHCLSWRWPPHCGGPANNVCTYELCVYPWQDDL